MELISVLPPAELGFQAIVCSWGWKDFTPFSCGFSPLVPSLLLHHVPLSTYPSPKIKSSKDSEWNNAGSPFMISSWSFPTWHLIWKWVLVYAIVLLDMLWIIRSVRNAMHNGLHHNLLTTELGSGNWHYGALHGLYWTHKHELKYYCVTEWFLSITVRCSNQITLKCCIPGCVSLH